MKLTKSAKMLVLALAAALLTGCSDNETKDGQKPETMNHTEKIPTQEETMDWTDLETLCPHS